MAKIIGNKNQYLIMLVLYSVLLAGFVYFRFNGSWLPNDAANLTAVTLGMAAEATIAPSTGGYFGYVYPALNVFLAEATGMDVSAIQSVIQPFLIVLLIPIVYVVYSKLTANQTIAALATFLLLLQPEFLFESLRSSHGKITWALAFGMVLILVNSFRVKKISAFITNIILFYLLAFALIASNPFWASNYIFGIAVAFLGGTILYQINKSDVQNLAPMRRLLLTTVSCTILLIVFILYLYPPSLELLYTLVRGVDQFALFFLEVDLERFTPVRDAYANSGLWVNGWLYIATNLITAAILVFSFYYWIHLASSIARGRKTVPLSLSFLWFLYLAFGLLILITTVLDLANVMAANLRVRSMPNLMIFAVPMASLALYPMIKSFQSRSVFTHKLASIGIAVLIITVSALSLIKMSNEPLFFNAWRFYSQQEDSSMAWIGNHLKSEYVWIGPEKRVESLEVTHPSWRKNNLLGIMGLIPMDSVKYMLTSEIMEKHAARLKIPLPDVRDHMLVYDNGAAYFYKRVPRTLYQR